MSGASNWLRQYAELFIPVAVIDPEVVDDGEVRRLHAMGYRGLKLIGVARDYDDPDYLPAYAAAEALGMPVLFHMGVIGGPIDYSITHPSRDAAAAQSLDRMRAAQARMGPRNVSGRAHEPAASRYDREPLPEPAHHRRTPGATRATTNMPHQSPAGVTMSGST